MTGMWTLAEDSGIGVDALKGELGVKTRRWGAGEESSDQEWIEYFMKRMEGVPEERRGAKFVCVAVFIDDKNLHIFEGETRGRITDELQAPILPGLPLSSVFRPEGYEKVYAALTRQEKGEISHRGQAISQVKKYLMSLPKP